ncbi:MAG: Uncharacterised protein [Acidimicrobiales bacterium AG-410-I20]|nr:MAG: Uncharacterised protein [Acidimicrobiales bacterium AG-410-I20]
MNSLIGGVSVVDGGLINQIQDPNIEIGKIKILNAKSWAVDTFFLDLHEILSKCAYWQKTL